MCRRFSKRPCIGYGLLFLLPHQAYFTVNTWHARILFTIISKYSKLVTSQIHIYSNHARTTGTGTTPTSDCFGFTNYPQVLSFPQSRVLRGMLFYREIAIIN